MERSKQRQLAVPNFIEALLQKKFEDPRKTKRIENSLFFGIGSRQEYIELGIPEEWIEPFQQLGYTTIAKLKEVEKPGKLANDLNGYKKKNKLDLPGLSPEQVAEWLKD